mgnify:CR=1 FL=1
MWESVQQAFTESLGVGNTLSILQMVFTSVVAIVLAWVKSKKDAQDVEIQDLNTKVDKLEGTIIELTVSQQAGLQAMSKIGQMVNTAYMNSKLSTEAKSEIAVLQGEVEGYLNVIAAEEIAKLEAKVNEYVDSKLEAIEDPALRNQVKGALGLLGDIAETVLEEVVETVVEDIPEYLQKITTKG